MTVWQGESQPNTKNWGHHLLTSQEIQEIIPLIEEQHGEKVEKIYGRIFNKVKSGEMTLRQFKIAITFFFE